MIEQKYVDEFIKTIKRGRFKSGNEIYARNYCDLSECERAEICYDAVYEGYLDAARTFNGNGLKGDNKYFRELSQKIQEYLDGDDSTFEHEELCKPLMENNKMTYGQAQKIVNMAFKYLYCIPHSTTDNRVELRFAKCHMPIDGVMLEWIYREVKPEMKKSKIGKWSRMSYSDDDEGNGYYSYKFYKDAINDYCQEKQKTPLQLDFENWGKMSFILSSEKFYNAIKDCNLNIYDGLKEESIKNIHNIINNIYDRTNIR